MSDVNDIFQVDYEPRQKELHINLPEELWNKIDNIIITRHFNELKKIRILHRESEVKQND